VGLVGGVYEVFVGIDIGQSQDYTAVVVADPEVRNKEIHYLIRFLKRLELKLEYPEVVENLKQFFANIRKYTVGHQMYIQAWVDATGVGKPVADLMRKEIPGIMLHEVYMTWGEAKEKVNTGAFSITLPKAYMVSRLQVLVSYGRIHLPNTNEALAMRDELMNYQIKVSESGNAQFGVFKTGEHDDLVTALGLACLHEPVVWDLDFMDEMIAMEIAERRFGHLRFSSWEDFFRKTGGWKKR
jgi:hypothetical protein